MRVKLDQYYRLKNSLSHEKAVVSSKLYVSGTVYTPDAISKKLIYMGLIRYLKINAPGHEQIMTVIFDAYINEKSIKLDTHDRQILKSLHDLMLTLSVIDLSSGTGMLIYTYIEFILFVGNLISVDPKTYLGDLFSSKIVAIDINENAIKSYISLSKMLCGCFGINLTSPQAYVGNALLDKFPFKNNSFDLILGNPPYIGEKGNTDIFKNIKATTMGQKYYEGKMDYFYFFVYKGYTYLKQTGVLCYLTSNYFFTADGAKKLRAFIQEQFPISSVLNFDSQQIFNEKKLHAAIYTLQKKPPDYVEIFDYKCNVKTKLPFEEVFKESGYLSFISDPILSDILNKMLKKSLSPLSSRYSVHQGLVSGADRLNGKGVFVYHESEIDALPLSVAQSLKPLYKNSSIVHYRIKGRTPYYILYETGFPEIPKHLEPFKTHLEKRREVRNGARNWFELTWPRNPEIFKGPKIVCPQRGKANFFAYTEVDFYASADVYFIKATTDTSYSLKVLALVLNSKIFRVWLQSNGKRKGKLLELYATPLKNLPLPNLSNEAISKLEHFAEMILCDNFNDQKVNKIAQEIDLIIYNTYELCESEQDYLNSLE